ncbi:hypothetical protein EGN72_17615 [Pseudorhodobacter sp. E13]|uniref:hypothetical protein n=1 Tax=Pseudorhodobacter sp. E13 TaxID=2487931 RepID=UPI000F8F28D5|nr:hypothetical protein [Pseudorhodobacter sp. E13]RUS58745.1 hypothetical protein EGN72_17615 [Pseudorhodobacter sp. E13]
MSNSRWVQILLALWLVVFLCSLALRVFGPAEGLGFLRGVERAAGFVIGQFFAGVVAMQARSFAIRLPKGDALRLVGQVPLMVTAAMIALAFVLIVRALNQGLA